MISKGIRGAITVSENTQEKLKIATIQLLSEIISQNKIQKDLISHVIFTTTDDLDAQFPAKFAREELGWDNVAMICTNEIDVPDSIRMCLRVLIVLNCEQDFNPNFVYLRGAQNLRR